MKHTPALPIDNAPRETLTLTAESIFLTRHDERGRPVSTHPVNVADVAAAFAGFADVTTGMLPPHTLLAGKRTCAIYLPAAKHTLHYHSFTLRVNLPAFVFAGCGHKYYLYAITGDPYQPRTPLFVAPLANIRDDASICAGSVKFPESKPSNIVKACELFWESEFNNDLSSDKVDSPKSLVKFLRELRGKFPASKLIATNETVESFLSKLPRLEGEN